MPSHIAGLVCPQIVSTDVDDCRLLAEWHEVRNSQQGRLSSIQIRTVQPLRNFDSVSGFTSCHSAKSPYTSTSVDTSRGPSPPSSPCGSWRWISRTRASTRACCRAHWTRRHHVRRYSRARERSQPEEQRGPGVRPLHPPLGGQEEQRTAPPADEQPFQPLDIAPGVGISANHLYGFERLNLQNTPTLQHRAHTSANSIHASLTFVGRDASSGALLPFGTTDLVERHIPPASFGLFRLSQDGTPSEAHLF